MQTVTSKKRILTYSVMSPDSMNGVYVSSTLDPDKNQDRSGQEMTAQS